jgi:predicted Co/Zn/Cd cation transporter (cation efflux family)
MDDKFLIFAFTCLCGGTFILYERTSMIYLEFGIFRLDSAAYQIAEEQSDDIYNQSKWQLAYSILLWTTIFAVKWCYFALFHSFLQIMSKGFNIYYKFSICFSVVCWLFVAVGDQLIACPYIGEASGESSSTIFSRR